MIRSWTDNQRHGRLSRDYIFWCVCCEARTVRYSLQHLLASAGSSAGKYFRQSLLVSVVFAWQHQSGLRMVRLYLHMHTVHSNHITVCVCVYLCLRACVPACMCMRKCMRAFVLTRVRACVHVCVRACVCMRSCVCASTRACVQECILKRQRQTEKQRQRGEINQRCLKNVRPSLTQVQASSPTWVQACSPTGWKRCPTYGNQRAKSCCVPSQAYVGAGGGELHKHTSFSFLCMHINFDHQRTFFFPGTYLFQCS